MITKLENSGIKKHEYTIIEAVDGKDLTKDKLKKMNVDFLKEWREPSSGRNTTYGEIGCALSHYNIYKTCIENNIENALILEDDIELPQQLLYHINLIQNRLEDIKDWSMCYIGRKYLDNPVHKDVEYNDMFVKAGFSYWTCSYIINKKGMKTIVDSTFIKNIIAIDEFLNIINKTSPNNKYYDVYDIKQPFNIYSIKDLICKPEDQAFHYSDTEHSKVVSNVQSNLLVLLFTKTNNDKLTRFKKSCQVYGINYKIIKYNYTKKKLLDVLSNQKNKQIVMVLKNENTIMCTNCHEILSKYKKLNKDIVLINEQSYNSSLDLDSNGFIGNVKSIKQLLSNNQMLDKKIIQDTNFEIFLHYNGSLYDKISVDHNTSRIICKQTNIMPCLITSDNSLENSVNLNNFEGFLMNNWTFSYGFNSKNLIDLNKIKKQINIYINIYFNDSVINNEEFIHIIYNNIDNNIKELTNHDININVVKKTISKDLNNCIENAIQLDIDYFWNIDTFHLILNNKTLLHLILHDKGIISPILDKNQYTEKKLQGCWNIPSLINGIFLVKKEYLSKIKNFFSDSIDKYMIFSKRCLENGIFIYLDTLELYGDINPAIKLTNPTISTPPSNNPPSNNPPSKNPPSNNPPSNNPPSNNPLLRWANNQNKTNNNENKTNNNENKTNNNENKTNNNKLYDNIIIIPYRDRKEQLDYFIKESVPLIQQYLPNSKVVIIEQTEGKLFNRGAVLNIGFKEYLNKTNYFITNDVDIYPTKKCILEYYNKYANNSTILGIYTPMDTLGSIIKLDSDIIQKINGFPNDIWGWGMEDVALKERADYYNIKIQTLLSNIGNFEEHPEYFLRKNNINDRNNTNEQKAYYVYQYIYNKLNHQEKNQLIMSSGLNNINYKVINHTKIHDIVDHIKVDIIEDHNNFKNITKSFSNEKLKDELIKSENDFNRWTNEWIEDVKRITEERKKNKVNQPSQPFQPLDPPKDEPKNIDIQNIVNLWRLETKKIVQEDTLLFGGTN